LVSGVELRVAGRECRALLPLGRTAGCGLLGFGLQGHAVGPVGAAHQAREDDAAQGIVLAPRPLLAAALHRVLAQDGPVERIVHDERFAVLARHLLGNLAAPPVEAVAEHERRDGFYLPIDARKILFMSFLGH